MTTSLAKLRNHIPLIFFQLYLSGTILLFAFGPWQWIVKDDVRLYGFLLLAQAAIFVGYMAAVWQERGVGESFAEPKFGTLIFRIALLVNIVFAVPTSWARSNSWVPNIVDGIQHPGAVYMASVARLSTFGPHVYVEYGRILFAVIIAPLVPLTILYWRKLSRLEKIFASATIGWYLAIYIAVGQNKGLADAIATWALLVLAGSIFRRLPLREIAIKLPIAYMVALVVFFSYFGMTQLLRDGGAVANQPGMFTWQPPAGTESVSTSSSPARTESAPTEAESVPTSSSPSRVESAPTPLMIVTHPDHFIARIAPDFVRTAYESFARYLGQGYQAVAFSFDLSAPSTLGLGNSTFLARNADRLLDTKFFETQSLPAILERETGWSLLMQWHSIYPWIASDVGYPGALVVMAVLGFLLGKSWMRTLKTADPLWTTFLYMMLIVFYYIPANNQIMQNGETAVGFIVLLALIAIRSLSRRLVNLDRSKLGLTA